MARPTGPTPRPTMPLRGAVDLGALAARRPAAATAGTGSAAATGDRPAGAGYVVDTSDATFATDVVEVSLTVPVVLDFWADWCGPCKQLSPVLEALAEEYAGRFLLAKVDSDANPQLSQAFAVQSIPSVFAVIKGQPIPMFQGALPAGQVRQVLEELLRVAQANGVDGRLPAAGPEAPSDDAPGEPVEEPLPPLHQEAYDAIERDDLDAAASAYQRALLESPADSEAKLGLANVRLLQRTTDVDPQAALSAAAAAPADVAAQLLAADLEVLGGRPEDAFARLVGTVRITVGDERNVVREHLVELFELVGGDDPAVLRARGALASALY